MEFRVLGPLRVSDSGEEIDLGPRKQRALIAFLAMHPNRVVATDRIMEALWGEDSFGKENALWVYISRLRGLLDPSRESGDDSILRTADHGYVLDIGDDDIDSVRFEELATEGHRLVQDDPGTARTLLTDALAMWRGPFLEDFANEDFTSAERTRLEEIRITAQEDRVDARLRLGESGELVAELEAMHDEHPFRERIVSLLMISLYRAGRHAEALRAYERHRRSLRDELGLDPSPELQRVEEQILLHDPRLQRRGSPMPRARSDADNPFKGLRPFDEDDDTAFFGRDRLVADVTRRIGEGARLVTLIGASGSGKSSAVRAGVIPAIRKGSIEGSDDWLIAQMVPGAHPFAELEAALLRSTLDAPDSLETQLADGDVGLLRAALRVLPSGTSRLVLVIDQFEELFTTVDSEAVRDRFLANLGPALDDPHGRIVVIATLRADFYDQALLHPDFATRMANGVVNVVPLTPDELEAAASAPVERVGVTIEPALLATLITDVVGQPGALPLFQYTLTELFERRTEDHLTLETYQSMGGVRGALARRADDLYGGLSHDEQVVAKQVFLRLVSVAEGDQSVRRRVAAGELIGLEDDVVMTQAVIDEFGAHRLLSFDLDPVTGSPTLEVAHEALLTEWPRLHDWIDEARDDLRRQATLSTIMAEWIRNGRDDGYLLTGARLTDYAAWAETSFVRLTDWESTFVQRSVEAERERSEAASDGGGIGRGRSVLLVAGGAIAAAVISVIALLAFTGGDSQRSDIDFVSFGPDFVITNQIRNGIETAITRFDLDAQHIQPQSNAEEELRALLANEPALLVWGALQFDFPGDAAQIMADHPETTFATLDFSFRDLDNIVTTDFAVEESAFLVGAAAALTSETGVVGYVGALPWVVDPFQAGYEAGARYADPDVVVLTKSLISVFADVFSDPALGADAARELYEMDADVIFSAAGFSGTGVQSAAADLSDELGRQLWAIGVDGDEWLRAEAAERAHILTSALKRHDSAVVALVEAHINGSSGDSVRLDLANDGVGYSTSGGHLSDATIATLDDLRQQIIDGSIEVPDEVVGANSVRPPFDTTITLTFDGVECTVAVTGPVAAMSIASIDMVNNSSEWVSFEVSHPFSLPFFQGVSGGLNRSAELFLPDSGQMEFACTNESVSSVPAPVVINQPEPDVVVDVVYDGETCITAIPEAYPLGTVVQTDITNNSALPMRLGAEPLVIGTSPDDIRDLPPWEWPTVGQGAVLLADIAPGGTTSFIVTLDQEADWGVVCANGENIALAGIVRVR